MTVDDFVLGLPVLEETDFSNVEPFNLEFANFKESYTATMLINPIKAVKKVAAKKPAVTKEPTIKIAPASLAESKVIEKIAGLHKDGYAVTLKCEGRNKQVKDGECILKYIRANKPIELIGMRSGMAARTVQL